MVKITAIATMASFLAIWTSPAAADGRIFVSPEEFDCLIDHADDYFSQGDIIVVNFATCPTPPTFREKFTASRARNGLPRQGGGNASAPDASSLLQMTRSEMFCLLNRQDEIEHGADGSIALLPEECVQ